MSVSIITVSYNSAATIRDTIESVLNQTVPPKEYFIIDGLSTDRTVSIAQEYEMPFREKEISYSVVSEKDSGIYDAMNKGIRMATGDIIGIINSDDWFEKNAIEVVHKAHDDTSFDLFYANINIIKNEKKSFVKRSKFGSFPVSRNWNHPSSFITKKTYDELGNFDCDGLYDDFDLMLRIRKSGKKIVVYNDIIANFRSSGISHKKSLKECIRRIKDRYKCYRKNDYSRFYIVESVVAEFAKYILS